MHYLGQKHGLILTYAFVVYVLRSNVLLAHKQLRLLTQPRFLTRPMHDQFKACRLQRGPAAKVRYWAMGGRVDPTNALEAEMRLSVPELLNATEPRDLYLSCHWMRRGPRLAFDFNVPRIR